MKIFLQSLMIILILTSGGVIANGNDNLGEELFTIYQENDPVKIQNLMTGMMFPENFVDEKSIGHQPELLAGLRYYTLEQEWDINTTSWEDDGQIFYTYDANGNLLENHSQTWQYGWLDEYKIIYTYNAAGNPLSFQYDVWFGTSWVTWIKNTYTYNAQGYSTTWFGQMLNMSTMVLEDYQKATHTYDGNWYVIESLVEEWDGTAWVNHELFTFTNDGNGNPLEELRKDWDGSAWVNGRKYNYTYNANQDLTESIKQEWNGSSYDNVEKETYTFDGNYNMTSYLLETWNGSVWENYERDTWVYDGNNNNTDALTESWNGSAWEDVDKGTLSYDGSNNCTEEIWEFWSSGSYWENSDKLMHQYTPVGAIGNENDLIPNEFALSNYPNPFNPNTKIQFNLPETANISVKIYNINGELINMLINNQKQSAGVKVLQWNGTDCNNQIVSSGIYFIHFQSDKYNQVKRCLMIK